MAPTEPARLAPLPARVGPPSWVFPDPASAPAEGLVALGGDLAVETLVDAYRRGIFPWPHRGMPLPWFSPDPRGVIGAGAAHVSRSLRRRLAHCGWETTVDAAFDEVVRSCAERPRGEATWVTASMRAAYAALHRLGWAHSLEVWDGDELVGGIYGVRVGGCFTGESMFHRKTDASKVALVDLLDRLAEAGGAFLDVQIVTEHLRSMGAVEVSRQTFLERLAEVRERAVRLVLDRRPVARLIPRG
jgi:leucyl/phenylalanyl-tRNA--protein transferase